MMSFCILIQGLGSVLNRRGWGRSTVVQMKYPARELATTSSFLRQQPSWESFSWVFEECENGSFWGRRLVAFGPKKDPTHSSLAVIRHWVSRSLDILLPFSALGSPMPVKGDVDQPRVHGWRGVLSLFVEGGLTVDPLGVDEFETDDSQFRPVGSRRVGTSFLRSIVCNYPTSFFQELQGSTDSRVVAHLSLRV